MVRIPTNRELQRFNHVDLIYLTENDKFNALAEDVERTSRWDVLVMKDGSELWGTIKSEGEGEVEIVLKESRTPERVSMTEITDIERAKRPVLIGTVSIEKSERLSHCLNVVVSNTKY